jgi:hypothetical protein
MVDEHDADKRRHAIDDVPQGDESLAALSAVMGPDLEGLIEGAFRLWQRQNPAWASRTPTFERDMPSSPGRAVAARDEVVFTIHGTFAASPDDQGPEWWQVGSAAWCRIRDHLPPGIRMAQVGEVFHWSGLNLDSERVRAGMDLLDKLLALEKQAQPYHLIGHSHGGNVILEALVESERRRQAASPAAEEYALLSLDRLRSWTTVGTPFFWWVNPTATSPSTQRYRRREFSRGALTLAALERSRTRWLGLCHVMDEAVSALATAASRMEADIAPRWRISPHPWYPRSILSAPATWALRLVAAAYNRWALPRVNSLLVRAIKDSALGRDHPGRLVLSVLWAPQAEGYPAVLPFVVTKELEKIVEAAAAPAVASLRASLFNWRIDELFRAPTTALLHTSYFESVDVARIIAAHTIWASLGLLGFVGNEALVFSMKFVRQFKRDLLIWAKGRGTNSEWPTGNHVARCLGLSEESFSTEQMIGALLADPWARASFLRRMERADEKTRLTTVSSLMLALLGQLPARSGDTEEEQGTY